MITIEMIDQLKSRVNVSYEDAKEALEKTNGDILEAIIYLEKNSKINIEEPKQEEKKGENQTVSGVIKSFIKWSKKWINRGNENHIIVKKGDKIIMNISLTLFVLLVFFGFAVIIPLLVLAIFTGHKISFVGEDIEKTKANEISTKFENAANDIVEEIKK